MCRLPDIRLIKLKHIRMSSRNGKFNFPRVTPALSRVLKVIGPITFRLLKSWAHAGNIRQVKKCVAIMRTFSLAQKRDSRNMIQHAESQYSPSGAVVSLTLYDGDHPAFWTGIYQNNKEMCRYSENHKLSTQLKKIKVGILMVQLLNLRPHTPSISERR